MWIPTHFRTALLAIALASCTKSVEQSSLQPKQDPPQGSATLTLVSNPSEVCMVNDQYMASAQIPVAVGERTYYGCCEMCKGRLTNDPTVRAARDPVTGATVDKAIAVIARNETGKVLYFESEASFRRFASGASP